MWILILCGVTWASGEPKCLELKNAPIMTKQQCEKVANDYKRKFTSTLCVEKSTQNRDEAAK